MPVRRSRILGRAVLLLLLAAAGAAGAILLTRESTAAPTVRRAIGGSIPVQATRSGTEALASWPRRSGWTIVLVSVPKPGGKDEATAVAEAARTRSLPDVGVLDSSRYVGVRPGFWFVFTGIYRSEAEATGALRKARALVKTARVQRIGV
ncbi:MAG: hypothetical protein FJW96_14380 [Actinobacteria bacterium]|nr:hypothetical protein [Actinomycetota bacterium]